MPMGIGNYFCCIAGVLAVDGRVSDCFMTAGMVTGFFCFLLDDHWLA